MWKLTTCRLWAPLLIAVVVGCSPPPGPQPDASPPGFAEITITFFRASDGMQVGSTVVPPEGLTVSPVGRDRRFVIAATAGDSESGIAPMRISAETKWACFTPGAPDAQAKHGTLDSRSDEERTNPQLTATPLTLRNAHFSLDPFDGNPLRLVCPAAADASALDVNVTIQAQNAAGLQTTSGPIVVSYAPRPATP